MELNIRLTVLVVETARLERRGVNDNGRGLDVTILVSDTEEKIS